MVFNEDARVKIPAVLHLLRLGWGYLSLKASEWDASSNIFPALFHAAAARINPGLSAADSARLLQETQALLDNEDLGRAFYQRITQTSGLRLIDFDDLNNNSFHVVTELPCIHQGEEFRPDITLLINGLPLVFIEVKKPHNRDGILAERRRIDARCANPHFRRFINATQLMIFSNNMEYEEGAAQPLQGAFYATASYGKPHFNYFREEDAASLAAQLAAPDDAQTQRVLRDNNLHSIAHSAEFASNCQPHTPTNRICTSLLTRQRLAFLLRYGIAYVQGESGRVEKHIMRYPQLFASLAIARTLDAGVRKGIIWHTQGSGKTALAYYNTRALTDFFQTRGQVAKFYFIVDRIDLAAQAAAEFAKRGLAVHNINSRSDFAADMQSQQARHNASGQLEITVVNIQKFEQDAQAFADPNLRIQRVYFLDEVHRSYKPTGSFLASLVESDRSAIHIGLTGTPLLGDRSSRAVFGDYIHKYYYNASIADGYTLRLIREAIATHYQMELQQTLAQIEIEKGQIKRADLYADPRFVEPMLDYIVQDFEKSRATLADPSMGAMVICDSSEQARQMAEIFNAVYADPADNLADAAQDTIAAIAHTQPDSYAARSLQSHRVKTSALILHDEGDKTWRKDQVEAFKAGQIDILFVYNMLLTGFDAPRLKKLYLGRLVGQHNLLQALTRVNRSYGSHRFGYVVDFADISAEFEKTNQRYLAELQDELGDEGQFYSNLFKSAEEIAASIAAINQALFAFDTSNAEVFSRQISQIQDRGQLLALKNALAQARELYNTIRLQGQYEHLQALDFEKLNKLYRVADDALALFNLKERAESGEVDPGLLAQALENIVFRFVKIGQAEMLLADQLKNSLRHTREVLSSNFDQNDPEFIALYDELKRLFHHKNLQEISQADIQANTAALDALAAKAQELNRQNDLLRQKYAGDAKFARIHKRLLVQGTFAGVPAPALHSTLMGIKTQADAIVSASADRLHNESFFLADMQQIALKQTQAHLGGAMPISLPAIHTLSALLHSQYQAEYQSPSLNPNNNNRAQPW